MKYFFIILIVNFLFLSCSTGSKNIYRDGFPDIWWAPVSQELLASWEIPPQAADRAKSEVVLSKRNELGGFSNLAASDFELDNELYSSVEALWQSMKYPENTKDFRLKNKNIIWAYTREQVKKMSGFAAKKAGDLANDNMKNLNIKWITYKGKKIDYLGKDQDLHYNIIYRASLAKVNSNTELKNLLKKTKKLKFLADHKQRTKATLASKYYEIYMKIREEL